MPDQLSALYSDFLEGSYDCVDRVVLNAYFGWGYGRRISHLVACVVRFR